jgi:hypothetical protein
LHKINIVFLENLDILFLKITFFVAWMSLDQQRLENQRNSCLPCIKDGTPKSPQAAKPVSISEKIFTW